MKYALATMVVAVYVLHQDFWNWKDATLVGGVLPMGMAYHAGYAVLASIMMATLVKFAWPVDVERESDGVDALAEAASTDAEGAH